MSIYNTSRLGQNTDPKLIEEWINKGNKITKLKYGERSEQIEHTKGFYGRKPKKKEPTPDTDK